jgi:hypothetical protein
MSSQEFLFPEFGLTPDKFPRRKPGFMAGIQQYGVNVLKYGVVTNTRATHRVEIDLYSRAELLQGHRKDINLIKADPGRDGLYMALRIGAAVTGVAVAATVGIAHHEGTVRDNAKEQTQIEAAVRAPMVQIDKNTIVAAETPQNEIKTSYPAPGYVAYTGKDYQSLVVMRTRTAHGAGAHEPVPGEPVYASADNQNPDTITQYDGVTFTAGGDDAKVVERSYAKVAGSTFAGNYAGRWAVSLSGLGVDADSTVSGVHAVHPAVKDAANIWFPYLETPAAAAA